MKKKLGFLTTGVLSLGLILGACGGGTEPEEPAGDDTVDTGEGQEAEGDYVTDLQLGTGSTGGTYYPLGQEIANVLNANVEYDGFNVSAVASGASVDNLGQIFRGEMQLGMTVHIPAIEALAGEGDFEGAVVDNFGFLGYIYPEVSAARLILEAYGIEDGDYESFEEGFGDAAARIQDGQLDASFGLLGLPDSTTAELSLQREVVILPIDGEALAYVEENSDYGAYEIEADAYDFLDEPVSTVTAYAILVGSLDQVSEELGYEIVKGLYENAESITHPQGEHMTMDTVLLGSDSLPFHPGAERYFQEQGLID
ncbi:TAXI family TRAP transporter solute-binding subunit [Alkalihalobacillus oceani]|uniref:TAXI family TRAP transporter solute-binding subunit n=1 Tax=Halalkalibacter oceani TaxID=1653776 RepID=UPI00204089EA|nr:TAXI family TRAP transporter solute-binding subunit [Halalkalibacter oceani]MCM3762976.1 TAXI family TRAP transporter solute-binding subunit [Halalkalibacter oceani]